MPEKGGVVKVGKKKRDRREELLFGERSIRKDLLKEKKGSEQKKEVFKEAYPGGFLRRIHSTSEGDLARPRKKRP